MSLTLKLLTIISLLSISTFAKPATTIDEKVIKYEKKRIASNSRYKLQDISIYLKQEIPLKGWTGYVLQLSLNINGKDVKIKDTLFTNGTAISQELKNVKNGKSYKDFLSPEMPESYYDDEHFIAGNKNAKNKIVIFSDPLCPFCIDYVPEVINHVNKNSKNIALYYYHFPLLRIHPASDTITKAMIVAHKKGIKNIVSKIYSAQFEDNFEADETNQQKILDAVNKVLKTNITLNQISSNKIAEQIKKDQQLASNMLIEGTPSIFINGKVDKSRRKFEEIK
ncbi:MAG: DsbA family protein [Campylobacteraceae bacterium]|jgi:thiol:disulfide interchange protein DsbC|nr:DsbA family protein [Campylobacteraceae bacterium]MBT3883067.1 DsbA family protein [Campylobacteraceae bacterium]MBT4030727.1 DsbA family protein [Campylobacteraceae bacterium]MBT4178584.1 DsbA family protein [Campylobacteraceae bacterium]MBT4572698.1 DsbA family protein [Campylobacteraceae bacterium]